MDQDDNSQSESRQISENIVESKSNLSASKENDRELMADNIDLLFFDACKSADIPNTKLQKCQLSGSESYLPNKDRSHHDSFSHNRSVSLSMISVSSVDSNLLRNETNNFENDVHKVTNLACTDEEETLFNQSNDMNNFSMNKVISDTCKDNLSEEKHNDSYFKGATEGGVPRMEQSSRDRVNLQMSQINKKTSSENNQGKEQFTENKLHSNLSLNTRTRNNLTSRPTLADDNKLVKMSLLANPINIMQSNAHLINKSRNFLNFITEKSTNIMEKALLPQHLAMKYNHLARPVESDAARFYINNESFSKDVISDVNLSNSSIALNCIEKQNCGKSEDRRSDLLLHNTENEPNSFACVREKDIYDVSKECEEQLSENNSHRNKIVFSEKKNDTLETNDVNRLNYDITNEQATQSGGISVEYGGNEAINDVTQTENLHKDICGDDVSLDLNSLKRDTLDHPLYLALLEDYTSLKRKHSKLLDRVKGLEESHLANKSFHEVQTDTDTFVSQIENLEKTVNKLTADLDESLNTQEALKKECIAVNKEKENMVVKYAIGEERLIEANRYVMRKNYNKMFIQFDDIA